MLIVTDYFHHSEPRIKPHMLLVRVLSSITKKPWGSLDSNLLQASIQSMTLSRKTVLNSTADWNLKSFALNFGSRH